MSDLPQKTTPAELYDLYAYAYRTEPDPAERVRLAHELQRIAWIHLPIYAAKDIPVPCGPVRRSAPLMTLPGVITPPTPR